MYLLAFAEGGIQLVPDGTIFIHIAMILLMLWFLNRTLFKPINRILMERDSKTGGRFGAADDVLRQADEKLTAYETGLRSARAAGYSAIENTRAHALANRQQQIDQVKAEVETMLQTEKAALQNQVGTVRAQLQTDAQILAERISSSILRQV